MLTPADGLSGVPTKDSRTVNTVERELFIKQLTNIVHLRLRNTMVNWFDRRKSFSFWPPTPHQMIMSAETRMDALELNLRKWRTKDSTCGRSDESVACSPCLNKEQCLSITSRELFKEITDDEIGNICKFPLTPMVVLDHRLRTLDRSLVPPSTQAEIFRRTCLQSYLQTPPFEVISEVLEPLDNFSKYPPFPPKNHIVWGVGGSPKFCFGWNSNIFVT